MNAYELADAIEDWDSDGQWDTPAANMLRQQADRIAHLEMLLANRNEIIDKLDLTTPQIKELSDEEINLLKAEIAAHKKTNELLSQKIIELQEDNKK